MKQNIIGYVHLLIQTISVDDQDKQLNAKISLGQIATVETSIKKSGSTWNEVFLIEVPQNPPRLTIVCNSGQSVIGECRYDITPFIKHQGLSHAVESDLHNNQNQSQGHIKLKLTYFSAEYGSLRLRIFHMSLLPPFVQRFKTAKVRVKLGIHMQSTPEQSLQKEFDETVEVVILMPTMNLSFEVANDEGLIASYTITNIQKSNLLQQQTKAYQVSLFNNDKAVGLIKYQVDWIKGK